MIGPHVGQHGRSATSVAELPWDIPVELDAEVEIYGCGGYGNQTRRREMLLDVLCVGGFLVALVYPLALTPLEPWLLASHPILVETLIGTPEAFITAGAFARVGEVPLWLAIGAPLIGGDVLDPFSWWLGRRFGKRLLLLGARDERFRPVVLKVDDLLRRRGGWAVLLAYYLPLPNALIYAAAAESGMSLWSFIVLDLIGTALGIVPIILLGFAIGQGAVDLARLITEYAGIVTVALVGVLVARGLVRNRRRLRDVDFTA
jgi:membrane-associated protein